MCGERGGERGSDEDEDDDAALWGPSRKKELTRAAKRVGSCTIVATQGGSQAAAAGRSSGSPEISRSVREPKIAPGGHTDDRKRYGDDAGRHGG